MKVFESELFRKYLPIETLYEVIKKKHHVATHTKKVLYMNRHVKDFCEEARHFVLMDLKPPIYLHYDVTSWYHSSSGVVIKIERIAIYDNFNEYEAARLRGLHTTVNQDGVSLN